MTNPLIIILLAFLEFTIVNLYAQETRFFMPSEIKQAYEKGTRSYDGRWIPSSRSILLTLFTFNFRTTCVQRISINPFLIPTIL